MSYETYEGGDYVSPSEAEDKMDIVLVAVYATGSKPYVRTRPFTLDPFTWAEEKWTEGPVEGDVTFAIDPCRDGVAP